MEVTKMNNLTVVGNLTRDPEIRYTQSGKAVANVGIAVKRRFSKDETDFFDCTAWGKTAELCGEYLRKGSKIGVIGAIRQEKFEVEGQKRSKVIINIEQLEFLSSKPTEAKEDEVNKDATASEFPF